MKFEPTYGKLKNGKTVLIRNCEIQDAAKLLKSVKQQIADSIYIPKTEEEFTLTEEQEKKWISSFMVASNSLLLVAEYEDEIIGNIDLTGHTRKIMQQTAVIGMGMLLDYRNMGLGQLLLKGAIHWAKQNPQLELLWLQVYTENHLGVSLYKKMGFEENGILKNYFKQDGRYYDNLTMSLVVK